MLANSPIARAALKGPQPYVLGDDDIKHIAPRRAVYSARLGDEVVLLRVVGYRRETVGPRRNQLAAVVAEARSKSRKVMKWLIGIDPVRGEFIGLGLPFNVSR